MLPPSIARYTFCLMHDQSTQILAFISEEKSEDDVEQPCKACGFCQFISLNVIYLLIKVFVDLETPGYKSLEDASK